MIVLDASAVVEWLLGSARGEQVTQVLLGDSTGLFFAPDLLDVEVVQVFRRLARTEAVTSGRARAAIELLGQLPIERRPAGALVPRIWALRDNLSAYDAAYVALAEVLRCPLLTCDKRLAGTPGHGVEVIAVPPSSHPP